MSRPCPTCKRTNCGNHAACARSAERSADPVMRDVERLADALAHDLMSACRRGLPLASESHVADLAFLVTLRVQDQIVPRCSQLIRDKVGPKVKP